MSEQHATRFAAMVCDTLARVVAIREALACGDVTLGELIAEDLEHDLAAAMHQVQGLEAA
jgi:hypothetical protein